jgi:hypothetical protein
VFDNLLGVCFLSFFSISWKKIIIIIILFYFLGPPFSVNLSCLKFLLALVCVWLHDVVTLMNICFYNTLIMCSKISVNEIVDAIVEMAL